MPDFRSRPTNMQTAKQLGRPAHVQEVMLQTSGQVQAASNAATSEAALIDLGGDYLNVPGSLTAKINDLEARVADLEDDII